MLMEMEWGVTIDKPIDVVFEAYVGQLSQIWDLGPIEVVTDGSLRAGSRIMQVGEPKWGFQDPSTSITIDDFESGRRIVFTGHVDVPGYVRPESGFSSLFNLSMKPGWGVEATVDTHFLELGESRTRLVVMGRNRVSRFGAVTAFFTRWFGYWWVNRRLTQFRDRTQGKWQVSRIAI